MRFTKGAVGVRQPGKRSPGARRPCDSYAPRGVNWHRRKTGAMERRNQQKMKLTRRQLALSLAASSTLRSSPFDSPLSPLGVPRGIAPGRVTWAHDSAAVTWDGTGSWWEDAHNHQSVIDRMVSNSIRALPIKKAMLWPGRLSFNISIARMAEATRDTEPGRRSRSRRT